MRALLELLAHLSSQQTRGRNMATFLYPPVFVTTLPPMGGATSANQLIEISRLEDIVALITGKTMAILKDGVMELVEKNTINPLDTVAVPVEIVSASGQEMQFTINGDVIASISANGVSYSSIRVGDGSGNYVGVTVDKEALSYDAKLKAVIESFDSVSGSNTLSVNSPTANTVLSDIYARLGNILTQETSSATTLGTVTSTAAKQDDQTALLTTISAVPFATSVKQDDQTTAINGVTTAVNAVSTALGDVAKEVTLDKVNTAIGKQDDTSATTDTGTFSLIALFKRSLEKMTALALQLPASLGAKLSAASVSITPATDAVFNISSSVASSGSQSKGTVPSGTAVTVSAPVGAIGFILKNSEDSEGTLCWEIGGTANADSMEQSPMTGTAVVECSDDISIHAKGGNVKYMVQWFIK